MSNFRTLKQRRYSYDFSVAHKSYERNFLYLFVRCWYIWLMVFHRQDLLSWRRSKRPPMCGTCVRRIKHKANITRPLHTWRTCSAIKMCFLQQRSGKKKNGRPSRHRTVTLYHARRQCTFFIKEKGNVHSPTTLVRCPSCVLKQTEFIV